MSDQNNKDTNAGASWERYWDGSESGSAFSSGGASHPSIEQFWSEFFGRPELRNRSLRLLDIATGTGTVVNVAKAILPDLQLHCVDISGSALQAVSVRFPDARTYRMDAANLEFEDDSFDIVSSQYGAEYAGQQALLHAATKVATNGWLALLVHTDTSGIFRECEQAGQAIRRLQAARFLPLARQMFVAAYAAQNGGDRQTYQQSAQQLLPAYRELEAILSTYGAHVAGDTPLRLYQDVENIHQKLESFQSDEVIAWLDAMHAELDAYLGRMDSMCEAAVSLQEIAEISDSLLEQGFRLLRAEALIPASGELSLGFVLLAHKLNEAS